MRVDILDDLSTVEPEAWNALVGQDDPFVEHAFLRSLEVTDCVGGDSGWQPCHVTLWLGQRLVGAMPLYLKSHSYGEYIFDWTWAEAALQAGIPYYPKLVAMVPFTPATGRRLLFSADQDPDEVRLALLRAARELAQQLDVSSLHLMFLSEQEQALVKRHGELMPRTSCQFQWLNRGYRTFDQFLASLRAQARKQLRRERRRVHEAGLDVQVVPGPELDQAQWGALFEFYRSTCRRKGSYPYLNQRFFQEIRKTHAKRVLAVFASRERQVVAATLNFEKGRRIYGRYWGCRAHYDGLHFELCYYRLIERAIELGMDAFEAGAQGTHKLRRGLMPAPVHSAHWIRNPKLAGAVRDYLPCETRAVQGEMRVLAAHGPFRREG